MREIKQSSAFNIMIFMADSTDHVTGKTGLALTITLSKDGAAFTNLDTTWAASTVYSLGTYRIPITPNGYRYECTVAGTSGAVGPTWPTVVGNTVVDGTVTWTCRATSTERGNGWYNLALTSAHSDTLGDLVVRATGTGADAGERVLNVVANVEADTKAVADSILIDTGTTLDAAIAALQADLGDPSVDITSIYAQLLLIKGYVDTLETALATHEANRAAMQTILVTEHDATQIAVSAIPAVNVISATSGSVVVSAAKAGGTFQFVRGNEISYPYGPLGKDVTGRKIYFAVKKKASDTAYIIGFTDITANLTSAATFTGLIPFTAAMTKDLTVGKYYLSINSYDSADTTFVKPLTEATFVLDLVDRVINNP